MRNEIEFKELEGKTLSKIESSYNSIAFFCNDGSEYLLYHDQYCCESVTVDDIIGELEDLIGTPILRASEDISDKNPDGVTKEYQESFTWTFYNIATIKGHVTIRWYGESNGYYSESVSFVKRAQG